MNYSIEPTWAQLDEANRTHYARKARPPILDALDHARIVAWEFFNQYAEYPSGNPNFDPKRYSELLEGALKAEDAYHAEYRKYWGMA